ncbi:hypothetical protein GGI19_002584 [Coemansia pectinata]|uniref:Uncharacterized protein n=1 Tax=Coemansia pectinata TaxID=1052879 RepID=A0A9W8H1B1_9FUNG|nr:hypothetical protein GGI19_002584 [Coemansia pectinata]
MDIAELDRIDEEIDRLFARVAEPGDAAFRDTKHTLVMLQKRVSDTWDVMKRLTNGCARLSHLASVMAGTPTIPVVSNSPAPPTAASAQVADYSAAVPIADSSAAPVLPPHSSSAAPSYEPTLILQSTRDREASEARETREMNRDTPTILPPAPALHIMPTRIRLPQHTRIRPILSSAADKGKGVDTHDEVPTDPLSRKRPRIDMRGDDANAQPSGGYNDEASSNEEPLGSTQPILPYPGTPSIISSRHGSTEQSESMNAIRDSLGFDITFELLDEALGEFPLVPLDALPALYLHIFGRELVLDEICPREFNIKLTSVDGFGY